MTDEFLLSSFILDTYSLKNAAYTGANMLLQRGLT